jgi:pyruvate/2-oxoacid:ferredoxin oxidoreductase beta subunit
VDTTPSLAQDCPDLIGAPQRAARWSNRYRTYSMNSEFGRYNLSATGVPTANGNNWIYPD